jgi:putative restriction endonuclease
MFGRAVRTIPDSEFNLILAAGFAPDLKRSEASRLGAGADRRDGLAEGPAAFEGPARQRPLIETTLTRPFRDEAFRRHVRAAYDNRCALSGLKLINGGGRPEVQAAHIRPVASDGPDSVRNGLALSGTLHWMFDRGLVSIDDDWRILRANNLPEDVSRLIVPDGHLIVPKDETMQPHLSFLRFHRENVFKG